jgi:hypothetical protein
MRAYVGEGTSYVEGLCGPEVGDVNAVDDLQVRTHEISSVNNAINTLTKKFKVCFLRGSCCVIASHFNRHENSEVLSTLHSLPFGPRPEFDRFA